MANVVVVGSQWGDEGKGKIVDWLSERADVVVRFQGGHNAGHTLQVDATTYKLSLLPSGVVRPDKLSILGNGVVVDPWALLAEIGQIAKQGVDVTPDNLLISENATLILPLHGELDRAREAARGSAALGTTGRGIGPAYEDKAARRAVRICDLSDPDTLARKVDMLLEHHDALRRGMGLAAVDRDRLVAGLEAVAVRLLPFVRPVWRRLDDLRRRGRRILFEGAQGHFLDVDHGTYPYVTSSNTVAAAAALRRGHRTRGVALRARYHQGLCDARGRGAVSHGTGQRDGPASGRAGQGVRHRDRPGAALRLVRRGHGAPGHRHRRNRRYRAYQA